MSLIVVRLPDTDYGNGNPLHSAALSPNSIYAVAPLLRIRCIEVSCFPVTVKESFSPVRLAGLTGALMNGV